MWLYMDIFCRYFLYFIIYAFAGWVMEVACQFVTQKRFINRGFLIGPICPIYGHGVLAIILLIGRDTSDILAVFLKAILICSVLEYFTSYFMEKLFKARWWDYSNRKYNINGRICLETMVPFGLLGCGVVYFLHPIVVEIVDLLNPTLMMVLAIILCIVYVIDNIVSLSVMERIKDVIKKQNFDNTEFIHKQVRDWIGSNSFLYRHIAKAFPKFKIYNRTVSGVKNGKSI